MNCYRKHYWTGSHSSEHCSIALKAQITFFSPLPENVVADYFLLSIFLVNLPVKLATLFMMISSNISFLWHNMNNEEEYFQTHTGLWIKLMGEAFSKVDEGLSSPQLPWRDNRGCIDPIQGPAVLKEVSSSLTLVPASRAGWNSPIGCSCISQHCLIQQQDTCSLPLSQR